VEVPPLPAKYFRQFQKKEIPSRPKVPIEDGVKAEDILDRILEGKMTVTPKELWAIVSKLWTALKEILTSRRASAEGKGLSLESARQTLKFPLIPINGYMQEIGGYFLKDCLA